MENQNTVSAEWIKPLIQKAYEAQAYAYVPYSGFLVGAALLCADGTIVTGCNIENAAYTPTSCAERTAVCKAVSEGHRAFRAIAIVGGQGQYLAPCGVCRQVLMEFADPDQFEVILAKSESDYQVLLLRELLPYAFSQADLTRV